MHNTHLSRWTPRRGFTLIELLIVIAIILILIAIALPNFLEAQERARTARGKAHLKTIETAALSHYTMYGFLYADYNDGFQVIRKTRNKTSPTIGVPCPVIPPVITSKGGLDFNDDGPAPGGDFQRNYYAPNLHCPLTTPVKFVDAAILVDPWSDSTVPVGLDVYIEGPDDPKSIYYGAYFVAGPDKVEGQWYRGFAGAPGTKCPDPNTTFKSIAYSPTNGTTSCGDLWVVVAMNTAFAKQHYDPLNSY